MKTTNANLVTFLNTASAWLAANTADTRGRDTLLEAIKLAQPVGMAHNKKLEAISKKHCAVEPATLNGKENPRAGIILRDDKKELCFTQAGEDARDAEQLMWFKETEIEVETVEPLSAQDVASMKLTAAEREAFSGFVLTVVDEESAA